MHDIRAIREAPEAFDAALARRGLAPQSSDILSLDEARRACIQAAEAALAERNAASKDVGRAKAGGDEAEFERLRALVAAKKDEIAALEEEAKEKDAELRDLLSGIPNLPYDDVPDGTDEDDNVEIHRWGTPREFDFQPKEHFELTGIAPGMDFETAAKLSGSRFVLMSGAVARLHRALAQFMLDTHTEENGLTEVNGPVLVRPEIMYGTGQLPKFGEDSYETTNGWWLIPTSEVSLTNIVAGHIVEEDYLPRRYTAHSLCFRSEAGSAGRDTAGMLRQHQFEKVEMVSVTHPDAVRRRTETHAALRRGHPGGARPALPHRGPVHRRHGLRRAAHIRYRGLAAGQNTYREISSVSTCGDFQARRMNARFRPAGGGKPEFVHTLNGSGLAVGRCLIAVLENGQTAEGGVVLPQVLHPYLRGATQITPEGQLA
jgi:seryl-tRNA synthetase